MSLSQLTLSKIYLCFLISAKIEIKKSSIVKMAQTDTQIFLAIIIFLALGGFILFWFLDKQCDRCRDKRMTQRYQKWKDNRDNPRGNLQPTPQYIQERFSKKPSLPDQYTGPTRMDRIYESQDYYKSHPFIYPTPNSFVTSSFTIKRALKEIGGMFE